MKYTVSIDEAKGSITITPVNAEKEKTKEIEPSPMATQMTVTMLAKQLEKVLPEGQIIVAVGGGDHCLTKQGKEWLASIAGVSAKCDCKCHKVDDEAYDKGYEEGYSYGYDKGYEEGYDDGYADADAEDEECEDCEDYSEAMARIVAILDEVGALD